MKNVARILIGVNRWDVFFALTHFFKNILSITLWKRETGTLTKKEFSLNFVVTKLQKNSDEQNKKTWFRSMDHHIIYWFEQNTIIDIFAKESR